MSHNYLDWAKYQNRHSSKSIKVIKLSFCQNAPPMGESFWQKDSLITLILFELCLFWYLAQLQIWCTTLYNITEYVFSGNCHWSIEFIWYSFLNLTFEIYSAETKIGHFKTDWGFLVTDLVSCASKSRNKSVSLFNKKTI